MSMRARVARAKNLRIRWLPPAFYKPAEPLLECDEEGNPETIVCSDMTRRPARSTGKEGALKEACDQVKVSLVTVVEPVEVIRFRRLFAKLTPEQMKHEAFDYDLALLQIYLIVNGGKTLKAEWAPKQVVAEDGTVTQVDVYAYHEIDAKGATRRYGVHADDICEKIPGARK